MKSSKISALSRGKRLILPNPKCFSLITCRMKFAPLSSSLGIDRTLDLGKYLGIPIFHSRPNRQVFRPIEDKVRSKLAGWKTKFLSKAGRLVLIKVVHTALPLYTMQCCALPKATTEALDKLSRDFLWGSSPNHRKLHLVGWNDISRPKHIGGLGIRSATDCNITALANSAWRLLQSKNSPWASMLYAKYLHSRSPGCFRSSDSFIWRSLGKGWNLLSKGLRWVPQNGKSI